MESFFYHIVFAILKYPDSFSTFYSTIDIFKQQENMLSMTSHDMLCTFSEAIQTTKLWKKINVRKVKRCPGSQ